MDNFCRYRYVFLSILSFALCALGIHSVFSLFVPCTKKHELLLCMSSVHNNTVHANGVPLQVGQASHFLRILMPVRLRARRARRSSSDHFSCAPPGV